MDALNALIPVAMIALIGITLYSANRAAVTGALRTARGMLSPLLLLNGLVAVNALAAGGALDGVSGGLLTAAALTGLLASIIGWAVMNSLVLRTRLRFILPAATQYDPHSIVHTTAIVLMLLAISFTLSNFALSGGLQGVADSLASGVTLADVAFNQALWLVGAALGIGVAVRRGLRDGLNRLGLRFPTVPSVTAGLAVGGGMVIFAFAFTIVWVLLVSPETFAEQTAASSVVSRSFNTIALAFGLSIMAAVGEEIFFRGALQPVFGNVATSFFFIALHTQYTLTPASLMLFFTSLAFGWVRQRFDTSAAIVAHFIYNFIQLALAASISG
jgi:uncharacterized protein